MWIKNGTIGKQERPHITHEQSNTHHIKTQARKQNKSDTNFHKRKGVGF